jgi:predicted porin
MFAKKNLVAVAALMAVAGAAHADVKLYGMLDASFGSYEDAHAKDAPSSRVTKVQSGDMMTSYIGMSGEEDLGGGLKAGFALESFVGADTGGNVTNLAGQFWSRTSNVYLSGNFGKVALGQYDNPLFTSGYTYNPFGSSMTFSPTMRHYYGLYGATNSTGVGPLANGASKNTLGFDTGWVNSVTYESPVFSGFQFTAQFAPKETTNTAVDPKNSYTLAGSYNNGPFSAQLTYVNAGLTDSTTAYQADQKVSALGASYDFGVLKAFGQYTYVKTGAYLGFTAAGNTTSPTLNADANAKNKMWQLGVSVPVTDKGAVLASFGQNKATSVNLINGSEKDEVFSLGYDYNLSKRTDVYAVFSNDRQSANTGNTAAGQTVAVGMRVNF